MDNSILCFKNIPEDFNEEMLFDKFQSTGQVLSVYLCREKITRDSLGYGYVIYDDLESCGRAYYSFNNTIIKGRTIRLEKVAPNTSFRSGTDCFFCEFSRLGTEDVPVPSSVEIKAYDNKYESEGFVTVRPLSFQQASRPESPSHEAQKTELGKIRNDIIRTYLEFHTKRFYPRHAVNITGLILKTFPVAEQLHLLESATFLQKTATDIVPIYETIESLNYDSY